MCFLCPHKMVLLGCLIVLLHSFPLLRGVSVTEGVNVFFLGAIAEELALFVLGNHHHLASGISDHQFWHNLLNLWLIISQERSQWGGGYGG